MKQVFQVPFIKFFLQNQRDPEAMPIEMRIEATTGMITPGLVQNVPPYSEWMISSGAMVATKIIELYKD